MAIRPSRSTGSSPCGSAARIDQYRYINGDFRNSVGFIEYFEECNELVGWDSYTWLNGSNGYWKYGHPEMLDLNVYLYYGFESGKHNFIPDPGTSIPVYLVNETKRFADINSSYANYDHYTGAGTDWLFHWTDRQRTYYHYNVYTTPIVSGGYYGASGGGITEYESGDKDQAMPVHVSVNDRDDTHYYSISLPYPDNILPVGWYVDVPEWR